MGEVGQLYEPHVSRWDFVRMLAMVSSSLALAACGVTNDTMAFLPEGEIEKKIPHDLRTGIARLEITGMVPYGVAQPTKVGSGQVLAETQDHLVINTAQHVGRGVGWERLDVAFPWGVSNKGQTIDARIDAPNGPKPKDTDWWIQEMFDTGPIRTIIIRKPRGTNIFVVPDSYGYAKAATQMPKKGDVFYMVGFPKATDLNPVASELTFTEVISARELPDAGIDLFAFSGAAGFGESGAAIFTPDGRIAAFLSRGPEEGEKGPLLGIPFVNYKYLDIAGIFKIIRPGQ